MLLSRMGRLHYNWKYLFLRPTIGEVVKRYLEKFHKKEVAAPSPATQPSSGEASSSADAPAAPTATPTAAEA